VPDILYFARRTKSLEGFRRRMMEHIHAVEYETFHDGNDLTDKSIIRVRDCARTIQRIFSLRSENRSKFSVLQALKDIALNVERSDLSPAFYAELLHLMLGLEGRGIEKDLEARYLTRVSLHGREAALHRSRQLDMLSDAVDERIARFVTGLDEDAVHRRGKRVENLMHQLGVSSQQWNDWRWQMRNVVRDPNLLDHLVTLRPDEKKAVTQARKEGIPFGITPYYLSLMDDDPGLGHDIGLRAQVIPSTKYVKGYLREERSCLDFMKENDTSPVELITRRYPGICIYKPFNTCPQICVYCQRNWEIDDAMAPGALAPGKRRIAAVEWIRSHPAIHEVLLTGGDPLAMSDGRLEEILNDLAAIPSIERIRIGTRTLVTVPMRITEELADLLARYRIPGRRQVSVVTHIQYPYEITPDTVTVVERLRSRGISVFNQLVYTFHISRRFEAYLLRRILVRAGVEPYYTFNTKGKEETKDYRVPLARLLQEQKEEARLLPGLARTDEAVYNVPGMGKNYLRARQHRDLISILPDGSRLYEFHPWEKNITDDISTVLHQDVPILDYLKRLESLGEDTSEYETIWYYF